MTIEAAYQTLYSGALLVFALLILLVLIRSAIGPRITDRILSINMIGTMVICSIAILSQLLEESYLCDVAMIYAMISFVSVLIFARTYIPAKPKRTLTGEDAFAPISESDQGGAKKHRKKGGRRR